MRRVAIFPHLSFDGESIDGEQLSTLVGGSRVRYMEEPAWITSRTEIQIDGMKKLWTPTEGGGGGGGGGARGRTKNTYAKKKRTRC